VELANKPGNGKKEEGIMAKAKRKDDLNFVAAMTNEDLCEGERNNKCREQERRITLAVLTQSKTEMVDGFKSNFELLEETIKLVQDYEEYLKTLLELAGTAEARLLSVGMALCGCDSLEELRASEAGAAAGEGPGARA